MHSDGKKHANLTLTFCYCPLNLQVKSSLLLVLMHLFVTIISTIESSLAAKFTQSFYTSLSCKLF